VRNAATTPTGRPSSARSAGRRTLFNSLPFLYGFLPVTYLVFWRLRSKTDRYIWLTLTGYVFYAFWDYRFCALMAASTATSYFAGLGLLRWQDERRRRLCLIAPITVDLALLGYFKYANFFMDTANALAQRLDWSLYLSGPHIILPIGISFYTFHTITYIVDAYRRTITPTRHLFEFSCYVSLFSQLVAGPIVRFKQIESDLEHLDQADRTRGWSLGWSFFAIGLAKKVLLADTIAAIIDPALAAGGLSTAGVWLCMLGYAYQIYFDFSGYSDMAVGLGHLFGIRIPQNFNSPYKALDPSDFWRRWHISLSTCLRDYLYIPLGGNRGAAWKTTRNLLITMLLGGLWHGANWTFVIWGAYHGLLLIAYRVGGAGWDALPGPLRRALMFLLVVIGWVPFRAPNLDAALQIFGTMFGWASGATLVGGELLLPLLVLAGAIAHVARNSWEVDHRWRPAAALGMTVLFALCLGLIYAGQRMPFLYFQF
jgi:alginate O-acetyltransferase complex protein AlgI